MVRTSLRGTKVPSIGFRTRMSERQTDACLIGVPY